MSNTGNDEENLPPEEGANSETLGFEQALKKLEDIVEAMEKNDLPLETLLSRFKEGTNLAQICQTKLAEAEQKIQQLEKSAGEGFTLSPLPPGTKEPGSAE
jgi:exodeoxyribonuclease VII small subunit